MDLDTYANTLIDAGPSFSLISDDGIVWGCAGVSHIEGHRAAAWALIRDGIGPNFYRFHKGVRKFLDDCDYTRVEMTVDVSFVEAARWAKMLGFKVEGYMRQYFPNGEDALLYARVK